MRPRPFATSRHSQAPPRGGTSVGGGGARSGMPASAKLGRGGRPGGAWTGDGEVRHLQLQARLP